MNVIVTYFNFNLNDSTQRTSCYGLLVEVLSSPDGHTISNLSNAFDQNTRNSIAFL